MEGTVETDVVYALIKRINLFEESIGILEPIIGRIEKDLRNVIFAEDDGKRRKQLNEFYRTLDEEIKKAKEIEMQLDDLMIDKKSFQMEGLISSLASCIDVKLSHNELYLLMNYFFDLNNNKYGYLKALKENAEESNEIDKFITEIKVTEVLKNNHKFHFLNEYKGTFNLDFAREREEFDFFALGHPLINSIIEFCRDDSFNGAFTILNLKRSTLPQSLNRDLEQQNEFYLFVFTVKFQGFIIENQILPVIINRAGNEQEDLKNIILNIENYNRIFEFTDGKEPFNLFPDSFTKYQENAKKIVKAKTSIWKKEIKQLNDKIFTLEREKKKKIYSYNKRVLTLKVEAMQQRLERNQKRKPTERQLQNIRNLKDEVRKQERLRNIQKIEEEILFIDKDIKLAEKKLDDLSFEHEDLKNEMNRRNLSKFYTNLLSFAIIRIID
jgi:hypothetical protein